MERRRGAEMQGQLAWFAGVLGHSPDAVAAAIAGGDREQRTGGAIGAGDHQVGAERQRVVACARVDRLRQARHQGFEGVVDTDLARQFGGDLVERGEAGADGDGIAAATDARGPHFGGDRVAEQRDRGLARHRRDALRRRRSHDDTCRKRDAVAIDDGQLAAVLEGVVGGGAGVNIVVVQLPGEVGGDAGQGRCAAGGEDVARERRPARFGDGEGPGLAPDRVAGQRDGRGARGRRVDRGGAGGAGNQAGAEVDRAVAEQEQAAGIAVGDKPGVGIGIHLRDQVGQQRCAQLRQGGARGLAGVGADAGADLEREDPGLAFDKGGRIGHIGEVDPALGGHRFADRRRGRRVRGGGHSEGGRRGIAVDDDEVGAACGRTEGGSAGIARIVDQRRQRRCDALRGVAGHCAVGDRVARHAGHAELVADPQTAADRHAHRRRRHRRVDQRASLHHRIVDRQRAAGAVDDEQLRPFGQRGDIGLRPGVDRGGQAGRDLADAWQALQAAHSIHHQRHRVAGDDGGAAADGDADLPGLARHRRAAQRQRVGGHHRRAGAGDDGAGGRMVDLGQREGRTEGAAAALDDHQLCAVADGAEVGQRRQAAVVDVGGQRLGDRVTPFTGAHGVQNGHAVQHQREQVAAHRRAAEGGEADRGRRDRSAPRPGGTAERVEQSADGRAGGAGDHQARAFGAGAEAAAAVGDQERQRPRDLGQAVDHRHADGGVGDRHAATRHRGGGAEFAAVGAADQDHLAQRAGGVAVKRADAAGEEGRDLRHGGQLAGGGRVAGTVDQADAIAGAEGLGADGQGDAPGIARDHRALQRQGAGADHHRVIDIVDTHRPGIARHCCAGEIEHVGARRARRCCQGQGRADRQGRGGTAGGLHVDDHQTGAACQRGVVGQPGAGADGGGQGLGDLRQGIGERRGAGRLDGDGGRIGADLHRPGVTLARRAGKVEGEGLGARTCHRGRRDARHRQRGAGGEAAAGAPDHHQHVAFDQGGEAGQRRRVVDPGGEGGGHSGRHADRRRQLDAVDGQVPLFAGDADLVENDPGGIGRETVGGSGIADREHGASGVDDHHLRAVGAGGVAAQWRGRQRSQAVQLAGQAGGDRSGALGARRRVCHRRRHRCAAAGIDQHQGRQRAAAGGQDVDVDHHRGRAAGFDDGTGTAGDREGAAKGSAVAPRHHQLRALGGSDELHGLHRVVGIERCRQAGGDALHCLATGSGDAVSQSAQGDGPDFLIGRGAAQSDDSGTGKSLAEWRGLRLEGRREAAAGAPYQHQVGALGKRGEVVAQRQRDARRQRAGDRGDGLTDGNRVRDGAGDAVEGQLQRPGGANHRRTRQAQQADAGGARQDRAGTLVGVDHQQVGHGEAVAGAVDHHQLRAGAHRGDLGRRACIDRQRQACCQRRGGFDHVGALAGQKGLAGRALVEYRDRDSVGAVVADQGHADHLAQAQGRRQGRSAHRRLRISLDAELAGRRDLELRGEDQRCKARAAARDYHHPGADGEGGVAVRIAVVVLCALFILRREVDRASQAAGDLFEGLRGFRGLRLVVAILQQHHVLAARRPAAHRDGHAPDLAFDRAAGQGTGAHRGGGHRHRTLGGAAGARGGGDRDQRLGEHRASGIGQHQRGTVGDHGIVCRLEEAAVERCRQAARDRDAAVAAGNGVAEAGAADLQCPDLARHRQPGQFDRPGGQRSGAGNQPARWRGRREARRQRSDGREVLAAARHDQGAAFTGRDQRQAQVRLDRGGQFGGDHRHRFHRVGVGDTAHGDAPGLADRGVERHAGGTVVGQGQAGDGGRHHRAADAAGAAGVAGRRRDPAGGDKARRAGVLDHQGVAVTPCAVAAAGAVDLRGQAVDHFGQGDSGAHHVAMGAGDPAGAVVDADLDGPGVAGHRGAGKLDAAREAWQRIRRDHSHRGADGEGGGTGVAGGVDDDQRHPGAACAEVAGAVAVDRQRQRRGDGRHGIVGADDVAELLDRAGDVERDGPGAVLDRGAAEHQGAGGFRRPRRGEGDAVAGDDGLEA